MKKVNNYKGSSYLAAQLLAEGNEQKNRVHISCCWLREEWAALILAAIQSSLRQQKSLVLKTHTRISSLILWGDAATMAASVFSDFTKIINNCFSFL